MSNGTEKRVSLDNLQKILLIQALSIRISQAGIAWPHLIFDGNCQMLRFAVYSADDDLWRDYRSVIMDPLFCWVDSAERSLSACLDGCIDVLNRLISEPEIELSLLTHSTALQASSRLSREVSNDA